MFREAKKVCLICFNLISGIKVLLLIYNCCFSTHAWSGFHLFPIGKQLFTLPVCFSACWVIDLKQIPSQVWGHQKPTGTTNRKLLCSLPYSKQLDASSHGQRCGMGAIGFAAHFLLPHKWIFFLSKHCVKLLFRVEGSVRSTVL